MNEEFEKYRGFLTLENYSANSITVYLFAVKDFFNRFPNLTKANLNEYKCYLIDNFKPKTANLRITAINKWCEYVKKPQLRLKGIKEQQKTYLENVISFADYLFFCEKLRNEREINIYWIVRFLATTGARVSELVNFKVENVKIGYVDIYSKGGKTRRIYFPKKMQKDALEYFNYFNISTGYIFKKADGTKVSTRYIAMQLKEKAKKYGINTDVVYPHSFRHMYAKQFLTKNQDISLLADLMGHENIETTRIYLRKTATEQKEIVDEVIDW